MESPRSFSLTMSARKQIRKLWLISPSAFSQASPTCTISQRVVVHIHYRNLPPSAFHADIIDAISKKNLPKTAPTLPRRFSRRKQLAESVPGLQDPRASKAMVYMSRRPHASKIRGYPAGLHPGVHKPGARLRTLVLSFRQRTGEFGRRNPRMR